MRKLLAAAAIGAALFVAIGVAAPAAKAATVVTAIITGQIRDGNDGDNTLFNGHLNTGDTFKLKAVFSTPPGTYDSTDGGSITGGGHATLTVNNKDYLFNLSPNSLGIDQYGSLKLFIGDTNSTFLSAAFYPLVGTLTDILSPFDADCYDTPGGYCSGSFEIVPQYAGAAFNASHLNISVATTPIPAALPLLGTSLLGLGFFARRKKAAAQA